MSEFSNCIQVEIPTVGKAKMALKVMLVLCLTFYLYRIVLGIDEDENLSFADYAHTLVDKLMDGYNPDVRPFDKTMVNIILSETVRIKIPIEQIAKSCLCTDCKRQF